MLPCSYTSWIRDFWQKSEQNFQKFHQEMLNLTYLAIAATDQDPPCFHMIKAAFTDSRQTGSDLIL